MADSHDSQQRRPSSRELYKLARVLVANVCTGAQPPGKPICHRGRSTSRPDLELRRIAVHLANQLYPSEGNRGRRSRARAATSFGRPVLAPDSRTVEAVDHGRHLDQEIESLEQAIAACEESGVLEPSRARRLRAIEKRMAEALSDR